MESFVLAIIHFLLTNNLQPFTHIFIHEELWEMALWIPQEVKEREKKKIYNYYSLRQKPNINNKLVQ